MTRAGGGRLASTALVPRASFREYCDIVPTGPINVRKRALAWRLRSANPSASASAGHD